MKMKKKIAIAAALFSAAANLTACAYGPPPEDPEPVGTNIYQTEFDPEDNRNADVYGPPIYESEDSETDTEYDPEENVSPTVYGPPIETD